MVLTPSKLGLYQRFLKRKFDSIEAQYYAIVDELTQVLGDLDEPGIVPQDFTLSEYTFIHQWEDGLISSAKVYEIMDKMNIEHAAKAKITKRLQNYMFKYEVLTPYIKPVIAKLDGECMDEMIVYLTIMRRFFKKMADIDEKQIKMSWVQQFFKKDKGPEIVSEEMTLNQTIHHIDAFIHESSGQRFHLRDQVIVFDEEVGVDDRAIHWIFGPRTYIELLRVLFNVKDDLGSEEIEFLKNVIKEVE
jgi:hypothetical protein